MPKNRKKTICFIHYGIGWRDGVNTVIETLVDGIQKQNLRLDFCFIGGKIKERFLEKADYKEIPELLPGEEYLNKNSIEERGLVIAKKIAQATEGATVVIIENPFVGEYHLPAMLGFSIYAAQFKLSGTKVFFRIHDLYADNPHYCDESLKFFSSLEIKNIIKGRGVDGFFVINRNLKEKLIKKGIPAEKISYFSNGIDETKFNKHLTDGEVGLIFDSLGISKKNRKDAKILLYPVRVVPRKNIEETILLVYYLRHITGENYSLIISGKIDESDTLSRDYYEVLKKIIEKVDFPVVFAKGALPLNRKYGADGGIEEYGIGDLYRASCATIMTSLREGFGYPFLECWFAEKIVIGRRIENVIEDFEKDGLSFKWLYDNFLVSEEDIINAEDEKSFERAKKVLNVLKDDKLKEQIFELNKTVILKQVEVLQNKKQREKIIKENLKVARSVYGSSENAKRFLKLVGI